MTDKKFLDINECERLLVEYKTPSHVINHCRAVCKVAVAIGNRLNEVYQSKEDLREKLNINLLESAAMLHDIARIYDNHEEVGADYLASLGYKEVSEVVRMHTTYDQFSPVSEIREIDILCIADRTTLEDKFVGVTKRMEYIKNKAIKMGKKEFVPYINIAEIEMNNYIKKLEDKMGITLDLLMKNI